MELTPKQQALRIIEESQNILLLTHSDPDGDAIGCLLACNQVLQGLGKKITMVAPGAHESTLNFLPNFNQIQNNLETKKESRIIISEKTGSVEAISWRRLDQDNIEIIVSGINLSPEDTKVKANHFSFDCAIVLDTASPERLGGIWENNADLFYEIPSICIDHHPSNSQFAKVNLIDFTASATAEILVSIFEALGKSSDIITKDVATCLLTGIMADTSSFMHANTTPKALTVAAQLVAAGADQQEIVRRVFNTNTLSTLRIWGRVLSYIKEDHENKFIWSALSRADYVAAGADDTNSNTSGVMNSLLKTAEDTDFALLIKEKPEGIFGSLRSISPNIDVSAIARLFGGGGHTKAAGFFIKDKKLQETEMEIINKIREYIRQQKIPNSSAISVNSQSEVI